MSKKLLMIIVAMVLLTGYAKANDIYVPAISVAEYQNALNTNGNVVFKNTKVPENLKSIAKKTFGESANNNASNEDNDKETLISPHIILGSNSLRGEYPEFTLVLVENNGLFFVLCGATLIDDNKVLTAAHCSDLPNSYHFIPNFYAFSDFSGGIPSNQIFSASSKSIHPNYTATATRIDHDVAVFTLASPASSQTAVLYDQDSALSGTNGTVIGVGLLSSQTEQTPNVLQEVGAPIVSNAACQSAWGSGVQITSTILCAGFTNSDRGSCNGDSGGPLWVTIDDKRIQAGIVSFGPADCANNSQVYSGYARVSALAAFIRQNAPGAAFSSEISNSVNLSPIYPILLE